MIPSTSDPSRSFTRGLKRLKYPGDADTLFRMIDRDNSGKVPFYIFYIYQKSECGRIVHLVTSANHTLFDTL